MNRAYPKIVRRLSVVALVFMGFAAGQRTLVADRPLLHIRPLSDARQTNGATTRRAFREVVQEANRWTVRVQVDDEDVALGVIVRADGYILTKGSPLPASGHVACVLPGRGAMPAQYIGYHPDHDLALLKVDADDLPVVRWQDDEDPAVGRWAVTPGGQGAPRAVGVISVARRPVPEVKVRGVLGVRLEDQGGAARVVDVLPDSAAEKAGLRIGDLITQVNQLAVGSSDAFINEISKHGPRDTLVLQVTREGKNVQTIRATLTEPFGDFLSRIDAQNEMGGRLSQRRTGFPAILQHDSVLAPEECGGPLVDLSGAAIGINIARAGRTESYAIPDDVACIAIDELLTGNYPPPHVRLAGATVDSTGDSTTVHTAGGSGGE